MLGKGLVSCEVQGSQGVGVFDGTIDGALGDVEMGDTGVNALSEVIL